MKPYIAALTIAIASCGGARADEWKPIDKTMFSSALALLFIDWGQTRDATQESGSSSVTVMSQVNDGPIVQSGVIDTRHRPYYEKNPFLGKSPSRSEVDRYFVLAMAGTAGLAYALPQNPRRWFLGGVIVIETVVVIDNHRIGLRVSF